MVKKGTQLFDWGEHKRDGSNYGRRFHDVGSRSSTANGHYTDPSRSFPSLISSGRAGIDRRFSPGILDAFSSHE